MKRTRRTPEEIARLCQLFRSSGFTQREFATRHGVHAATVRCWLRRQSKPSRSHQPRFVEVQTSEARDEPSEVLTVEFPDGVRLHFARRPDLAYITHILQTLRGV